MTPIVNCILLPGAVLTETNKVPVSSSGIKPVFVLFIRRTARTMEQASAIPAIHFRLNMRRNPDWYLLYSAR